MGFGSYLKKATQGVLVDPVVDLSQGKIGKSFADAWQNSPGGQIGSSIGDIGDKSAATWANIQGKKHASDPAADAARMQQTEEEQYGANKEFVRRLGESDQDYLGKQQGTVNKYQNDLAGLRDQITDSQMDARNTYTNDIQPRMKGLMETAQQNASGSMSLQDAMDPNNKVALGTRNLYNSLGDTQRNAYNTEGDYVRDLYNKQGGSVQDLYEKQAANEGRSGLADVGVLGALGAQNLAGQLGNVPMTGGQMQAMLGANMSQAGSAFANTQKRQQSLRDLGITGNLDMQNQGLSNLTAARAAGLGKQAGLQTQGLDAGFNRSDKMYGLGQEAQDRYGRSVNNYESASDRQQGREAGYRNELGSNRSSEYGLQSGQNALRNQIGNTGITREMANENTHLGGKQANIAADIAGANARTAGNNAVTTGALQAGGTVLGAIYGGPAGAAAGGQAGGALGNAAATPTQQIPQNNSGNYGNYGSYASAPPQQQQQMGGNQGLSLAQPPQDPNDPRLGRAYNPYA